MFKYIKEASPGLLEGPEPSGSNESILGNKCLECGHTLEHDEDGPWCPFCEGEDDPWTRLHPEAAKYAEPYKDFIYDSPKVDTEKQWSGDQEDLAYDMNYENPTRDLIHKEIHHPEVFSFIHEAIGILEGDEPQKVWTDHPLVRHIQQKHPDHYELNHDLNDIMDNAHDLEPDELSNWMADLDLAHEGAHEGGFFQKPNHTHTPQELNNLGWWGHEASKKEALGILDEEDPSEKMPNYWNSALVKHMHEAHPISWESVTNIGSSHNWEGKDRAEDRALNLLGQYHDLNFRGVCGKGAKDFGTKTAAPSYAPFDNEFVRSEQNPDDEKEYKPEYIINQENITEPQDMSGKIAADIDDKDNNKAAPSSKEAPNPDANASFSAKDNASFSNKDNASFNRISQIKEGIGVLDQDEPEGDPTEQYREHFRNFHNNAWADDPDMSSWQVFHDMQHENAKDPQRPKFFQDHSPKDLRTSGRGFTQGLDIDNYQAPSKMRLHLKEQHPTFFSHVESQLPNLDEEGLQKLHDQGAHHPVFMGDESPEFHHEKTSSKKNVDELVSRLKDPDGGFTYNIATGDEPSRGYAVAVPNHEQAHDHDSFFADPSGHLAEYVNSKKDLLQDNPNLYIGAWHDPETHQIFLDLSEVHDSPEKANEASRKQKQKAYTDLSTGKSIKTSRRIVRRAGDIIQGPWGQGPKSLHPSMVPAPQHPKDLYQESKGTEPQFGMGTPMVKHMDEVHNLVLPHSMEGSAFLEDLHDKDHRENHLGFLPHTHGDAKVLPFNREATVDPKEGIQRFKNHLEGVHGYDPEFTQTFIDGLYEDFPHFGDHTVYHELGDFHNEDHQEPLNMDKFVKHDPYNLHSGSRVIAEVSPIGESQSLETPEEMQGRLEKIHQNANGRPQLFNPEELNKNQRFVQASNNMPDEETMAYLKHLTSHDHNMHPEEILKKWDNDLKAYEAKGIEPDTFKDHIKGLHEYHHGRGIPNWAEGNADYTLREDYDLGGELYPHEHERDNGNPWDYKLSSREQPNDLELGYIKHLSGPQHGMSPEEILHVHEQEKNHPEAHDLADWLSGIHYESHASGGKNIGTNSLNHPMTHGPIVENVHQDFQPHDHPKDYKNEFNEMESLWKNRQASKYAEDDEFEDLEDKYYEQEPPKFNEGDHVQDFRGKPAVIHKVLPSTNPGKSHRVQVQWDDTEYPISGSPNSWLNGREHDETPYYEHVFQHYHPDFNQDEWDQKYKNSSIIHIGSIKESIGILEGEEPEENPWDKPQDPSNHHCQWCGGFSDNHTYGPVYRYLRPGDRLPVYLHEPHIEAWGQHRQGSLKTAEELDWFSIGHGSISANSPGDFAQGHNIYPVDPEMGWKRPHSQHALIVPHGGNIDQAKQFAERTLKELGADTSSHKWDPSNSEEQIYYPTKGWNHSDVHGYARINPTDVEIYHDKWHNSIPEAKEYSQHIHNMNKMSSKEAMPIRDYNHAQPNSLYPTNTRKEPQQGYDLTEGPLPSNVRDKMEKKWLAPIGLSRENALQNLRDTVNSASPENWKNGASWYHDVHNQNVQRAKELGVHPEIYHAVVAALSPNTDWNENSHAAQALLSSFRVNKDDPKLEQKLKNQIGRKNSYTGYPASISRAVELARHDPNASDNEIKQHIDQTLQGPKTRSFYNNMSDPDQNGNDVTVDKHGILAMLAGENPDRAKARDFYNQVSTQVGGVPQYQTAKFGIHPLVADNIRTVTNEFNQKNGTNYSPMQMQAVIWHREKDRQNAFNRQERSQRMRNNNPGTLGPINEQEMF